MNNSISIILYVLLLILVIDIYISYSFKFNMKEHFTIKSDSIICNLTKLCLLKNNIKKYNINKKKIPSQQNIIDIINIIILLYKKEIHHYYLYNTTNDTENMIDFYENRLQIHTNFIKQFNILKNFIEVDYNKNSNRNNKNYNLYKMVNLLKNVDSNKKYKCKELIKITKFIISVYLDKVIYLDISNNSNIKNLFLLVINNLVKIIKSKKIKCNSSVLKCL